MCLLNYILISLVTLTQSASLGVPGQPTEITLSSMIAEHPNFRNTLLNETLVPFIKECEPNAKIIPKMLCGSYFEMIKKLDDDKVDNLKSVDGFNEALNTYKEDRIDEFCKKFPGYLPKDVKQYPQSNSLNKLVSESAKCLLFCTDATELDKVKQMCIVLSAGWEKLLVQPSITTIKKQTTEEEHHADNVQSEATLTSGAALKFNVTSKSSAVPIGRSQTVDEKQPDDVPSVLETNIPSAGIIDETIAKVIPNANAELPVNQNEQRNNPNTGKEESAPKPITSTIQVSANQNPNPNEVKEEVKPEAKNLIPSGQQPSGPSGPSAETKYENVEDVDKTNSKTSVTEGDDNNENMIDTNNDLDETKLESDLISKEKSPNEDDINDDIDEKPEDGPEDSDDEELGSNIQVKSSQEAGPSKSQIIPDQNVDPFSNDTDSNFFTYFMFLLLVCVIAYVVYHNKTKMLALMLEGRRSSANGRGGLTRRKHTAAYRKLDSNLEEAITSSANGRSTQVIY